MKRNLIALAALGLFTFGCAESPTSTQADLADAPAFAAGAHGVVNHVSVGGADVCEALGLPTGCDANFSLTATMKADGSVKGQWQDTFAGGGEVTSKHVLSRADYAACLLDSLGNRDHHRRTLTVIPTDG